MTDWRNYERFVAQLMAGEANQDATIIPNARLVGRLSNRSRQIDVLIDSRFGQKEFRRIIVDAKFHKRRIDVNQVEAFEGLMKDVGAHRGILVCPNGHTESALRRAQDAITIRLASPSDLEYLDLMTLDSCSHSSCEGLLLWDASPALNIGGLLAISATAKCDECHRFNIWCWSCGEHFALEDEDERQCSCKGPWFWLTAIEDDSEDTSETLNAVYLLLVYGLGNYGFVDRKPLQ